MGRLTHSKTKKRSPGALERAFAAMSSDKKLSPAQLSALQTDFAYYVNKNLRASRLRRAGWSTPDIAERDLSRIDREKAMSLARQKVEESAITMAMVSGVTDGIVGNGFRLSMRTTDHDFNTLVEKRWEIDKNKLDVRQIRSWGKLNRMWHMRRLVDGDIGLLRHELELNYRVQTIEAERIRKRYSSDNDDHGVDYDSKTGAPITYYIGPRITRTDDAANRMAEGKPYPAERFKLYANFPGERAEQMRGVSMLTQNLSLFEDVEQIIENMVQKVKNTSFIGLKFKTNKGEGGASLPHEESKTDTEDGKKRRHVPMVAGMNLDLDEDEDASVLESNSPNTEFLPFLRFLIRILGAPFGFPLEMLLLDFTGLTFSGGRAMMELAKKRFRAEQDELAGVCSWVAMGWLETEIDQKRIAVPKELLADNTYKTHRWGRPPWPYISPVDEINSYGMALDRNFTTLDAILDDVSEYDLDDIIAQRKYEKEQLEAAGLPFVTGQGVVVNKPGQTVADEKDKQDKKELENQKP